MIKKLFVFHLFVRNFVIVLLLVISANIRGQTVNDSVLVNVSLDACIKYALSNQPSLHQTLLDEKITRQDVRIALSDWLPQVEANANLQHYIQQPVSIFPDFTNPTGPKREITSGVVNSSALQLSATQTIYSNDVFFAGRTAAEIRRRAAQGTESAKIDLVVGVSKAFYDVFLTKQQLEIVDEDIQRLQKNYSDAYNQYKSGVSDKIDYQRATIALNNAKADKRSVEETLKVKYAYLKEWMGYPKENDLTVTVDSATLIGETMIDTTQILDYNNRIEYKIQQTNLALANARVGYYRWGFVPEISAFANYNLIYQNDQFSELYKKQFPNSYIGLKASFPIFEGGKRWQNLQKAKFQYQQLGEGMTQLKNHMSSEYTQAIATYRSSMEILNASKENIDIARDIFNTVKFQYDKGIKTYLEVIVAETDLRTAQLNYLNALFRALSGALDLKKALGTISVN